MQVLSDSLIRLTQYQKGYNPIQFEIVELEKIIEEAERKVTPLAKQKDISFTNKVTPISLLADQLSITELLVILLDNAIKSSRQKTTITVSARRDDHHAVIELTDQGVGIAKEDLPH